MKLPEAAGLLLAFVARLITGAHGHGYGSRPKAGQRIDFAKHRTTPFRLSAAMRWYFGV
jgi:hypothetical protein